MRNTKITQVPKPWLLEHLQVSGSTGQMSTAKIALRIGRRIVKESGTGAELIEAVIDAINRLTATRGKLIYCSFHAKFRSRPTAYEIIASVNFNGRPATGKGASGDIIEASAQAYLSAVNQYLADKEDRTERDRSSI